MSDVAIAGVGAYAPAYRLERDAVAAAWDRSLASGVSSTAVPDADEDALTMAWEAATAALAAADRRADEVTYLALATTTPPLAEEEVVVRLGSTLGVAADAHHGTAMGSTRAGTQALLAALDAGPWADGVGVVVGADLPTGAPGSAREHAGGAGAGAIVLDADGPGAVVDRAEAVSPGPGERFRRSTSPHVEGLEITPFDRAVNTGVVTAAVDRLTTPLDDVDAAVIRAQDGKRPYRIAAALDLDADRVQAGTTVHTLGDTGAADVLLGLATAIERGHEMLLLVNYGSGAGVDALVIDAGGVPVRTALEGTQSVEYARAARLRGTLAPADVAGGGAYVSIPTWRRSIAQRHRHVAGRCRACGAVAFPPEGACPTCGAVDGYDEVPLGPTGTIEAITTITAGAAPPEFAAYQAGVGDFAVAIVSLEEPNGDAASVPLPVVSSAADLAVGDRIRTVVRHLYTQEGVPRYGRKVAPFDDGSVNA